MNLHGKDIRIFTGNSNPALAKSIAAGLGIEVGRAEVGTFSDGEISVSLQESVRGSDVFVIQSTCNPINDNLMELLIIIDALKRASAGRITAVIPYFGYARQDRKTKPRDPVSAKLVANLITEAGADRILAMDLHVPQIEGFFDIPVDHLMGIPILLPYFIDKFKNDKDDLMVVAPDLGSVARSRKLAERLDVPMAIVDKRRQQANVSEVMNIIGDVRDKRVIIVDDMIDTAGTLCQSANAIVEVGGAKEVYAGATHAVLSGKALENLQNSVIKELVLLDTIPVPPERRLPKMTFLSVAPVMAEAIQRIYTDAPVSVLFS